MPTVEPKFVIEITDEFAVVRYLKKYIALNKVQVTEQISLAKKDTRNRMIRCAILLRKNGLKAHARPV